DRPDKRNAISDEMIGGLVDAMTTAATDERLRVIVLTGAGDDFCGGADIVARNRDRDARPRAGSIQRRLPTQAHRLVPLLLQVQVPVVCMVRGWAAGIGFSLALAADFTIAADDAKFWEPFTERGFTPDSGATWLLPRRVGVVRARELLLLGRELSGTEAAAWGAIHAAVPGGRLDASVEELVSRLASGPTVALGLAKWLLQAGSGIALDQHLANEAFALELSSRTDDFREGMTAFRERRPPNFEGH
ncbi:MAG: 2-(1,2-epoxy,2-dihydrophenyl)acetyl-CoA isomerase, partial [Actinomycetota bacterium]|nr:2-(1,2-epoxy,2-dihydrophenyl)acetyl-CoA isomerase [Actinomycetota bacterium]